VKAASVLKGFLNKNPADRLGCHRESGFFDIVNHPFFKSIDWELVSHSFHRTLPFLLIFQNKKHFIEFIFSNPLDLTLQPIILN